MSGPFSHSGRAGTFRAAAGIVLDILQPLLAIFGALVILAVILIWKNPLNARTVLARRLFPASLPHPPMDPKNLALLTGSKIPSSSLTWELVENLMHLEREIGDSLSKTGELRDGGFLSAGRVWLGPSGYESDVIVWFDFYRECRCGPTMIDLIRFAYVNEKPIKILERRLPWEEYFLLPSDKYAATADDTS